MTDNSKFSLQRIPPAPLGDFEDHAKRKFQGIPSVARLASGRLFVVYYACSVAHEGPGNYVVLATSNDNGLSWKEVQVVSPGAARPQERAFDSEIWVAPDGALWWFWAQSHSEKSWDVFDGRVGVWAARCAAPDCDCPVWEEPRRLGEGVMMNKPVVLSDGTWVLPAALWAFPWAADRVPPEFQAFRRPNLLMSHDNGATFEMVAGPDVPPELVDCDEHMVVERRDGSLWMLIRTARGISGCTSEDGGRHWSQVAPLNYGSLVTRFNVTRLKSGNLLLVYHWSMTMLPGDSYRYTVNSDEIRRNLCAWISNDDGRTWHGRLMIDERHVVSYPSVAEGDDGFIYVAYDRDRCRVGQIMLSRFTEEDLERGDFVHPGSFRSVIVSAFGNQAP